MQPFNTVVVTVFMSRYLTAVAENAVGKNGRVHVAGLPIAPGSLFAYTVTASTIVLVALMPLVGALADRTGRKRDIMLGCGGLGALACVAMVLIGPTAWPLAADFALSLVLDKATLARTALCLAGVCGSPSACRCSAGCPNGSASPQRSSPGR